MDSVIKQLHQLTGTKIAILWASTMADGKKEFGLYETIHDMFDLPPDTPFEPAPFKVSHPEAFAAIVSGWADFVHPYMGELYSILVILQATDRRRLI